MELFAAEMDDDAVDEVAAAEEEEVEELGCALVLVVVLATACCGCCCCWPCCCDEDEALLACDGEFWIPLLCGDASDEPCGRAPSLVSISRLKVNPLLAALSTLAECGWCSCCGTIGICD